MERLRRAARKHSLVADERGLSTVEYVIILVLIAVLAIGAWNTFGAELVTKVENATDELVGLGADR
ncbi:MAG TPA: Flp family type IVb pilin [Polyangiaceae bacterium]|nr:Flp family type IVb pilin [Polyangiaceae bacterium]